MTIAVSFFACLFYFLRCFFAVRKTSPPQIVHPPHLYTNSAPTVINNNVTMNQPGGQPSAAYSSETATYVNVVSPSTRQQPPPYPHPQPPPPPMIRPPLYAGQHPGSGGHVPYSPVFAHHQHVRPVGIANVMPRQGSTNNNHDNNTQRQNSVGK